MKKPSAHRRHDINNHVWALLKPLLPGQAGKWGGIGRDNRLFINAVFWTLRTGAPWRDLPPDFGNWNTVAQRFFRWRDKGVWERLLAEIIHEPDFEWLMIDSTHIKVHPHATGARGGNDAMGRSKGGSTPSYMWPWMRMVLRCESLSAALSARIAQWRVS